MTTYIVRRLLFAMLTMLAVSIITYLLVYYGPVDPTRVLAGPRAQGASIETLRRELGLDQPFYVQYFSYMRQLLSGNLGQSWYFRKPVTEALFARFPATALMAISIMVVVLLIGLPLGAISALKVNSVFDRAVQVLGTIVMSMPEFFLGLILIYFLAFKLRLLPIGGYGTPKHLILPVMAVSSWLVVLYASVLRSNMLDVISADYIRTARSKGLHQRVILTRHMLRNALLPIVTMAGMQFAYLLTGVVLVETLFNFPGIGWQAAQAASHMDVPMIMGTVLFGATLIAGANLIVDVLYAVLDPRVRLA
ncbi:MAG: ABC transporter permease [Anaerolineae bacterium]